MKITANKAVAAKYELFVEGEKEGALELMERATAEAPLEFIYGTGMMLPKFEENLSGLSTGDNFDFVINVEDGYGDYQEENVLTLDRSIFELDGKLDEEVVFAGNVVPLMDTEGNRMNAQVVEVTASDVKVDLNHPLAGETLHFIGSIIEVRDATEKELAALVSGGCADGGCGDCGCDDTKESEGCGCN